MAILVMVNPSAQTNEDYHNGYKKKQVNSSYGSKITMPQDRKFTFESQMVKKHQKDISDIDQKIISIYAKGMTTRQISEILDAIHYSVRDNGVIRKLAVYAILGIS